MNTLQHTATHCNTLQHTVTHCNTLQHIATHCNTLQHVATHCNTLQQVICLDEIKMNLLGKSCLCPGFSTVICNLMMSASEARGSHFEPWFQEYVSGSGQEIYCTTISPQLAGKTFRSCCSVCCGVLRCVAVCCSVLQCVAVCCGVHKPRDLLRHYFATARWQDLHVLLQCVAVCCSIAVCCSVLQCNSSRSVKASFCSLTPRTPPTVHSAKKSCITT